MSIEEEITTEHFHKGLAVRRAVLGEDYVNKSLANVTEFSKPLQKLVTEWCWGEVWSRPGIERKQRSILNLAFLTALNRAHELKIHVRGAINNGVTQDEIAEIFLQAAIYCGVPASMESFRIAGEVFKEMAAEKEAAGTAND